MPHHESALARMTDEANVILSLASVEAEQQMEHPEVKPEHLLQGMLLKPTTIVGRVLARHGMTIESVRKTLRATPISTSVTPAFVVYDADARAIFNAAVEFSNLRSAKYDRITSGDLLHALMVSGNAQIERILADHGTTSQKVLHDLLS